MPAVIESTLYTAPGGALVAGSTQQNSREDAQPGYQVVLNSVHEATTYSWTLAFASDSPGDTVPGSFGGTESSSALLPPEGSTSRTAKFNVDFEGSYLIRLTTDAGLDTEDTQFIRVRALSLFGALKLVAAGERRDERGVIPVDATPEGWANDQNANFQRIALLLRRHAISGRVLYVDANRGRSDSNDQNDPDNVISIPGPDTTRPSETGVRLTARGHGDFSSINEAITYANNAASRGEPAPSLTEPYFIVVRPGLYTEDLALSPHVHIIGDADFEAFTSELLADGDGGLGQSPAIIRTVNAGGTGTHRFNPQANYDTAKLLIANVLLETTQDSDQPVLDVQGGLVQLRHCRIWQRGNAVNQGEALRCSVSNPLYAAQVWAFDSFIVSDAAGADRVALTFDATGSACVLSNTGVSGQNGVQVNESLYENCRFEALNHSIIEGVNPYVGYGSLNSFNQTQVRTDGAGTTPISIEPFGTNAGAAALSKPGACALHLFNSILSGDISYRSSIAAGTSRVRQSGCVNLTNTGGPRLLLPDAPGDVPDELSAQMYADSLRYVPDYSDPLLGPGAAATVPAANQSPKANVQEAIDLLFQVAMPLTGSPFYSLDSAYDGLASLNPLTPGVGLGRAITANGGAVVIQGATYPVATDDEAKNGGLQVEGMVDIGGLINGSGTVIEVGHSEIGLVPDLAGGGPFVGLGRARWLNGVTTNDRGFMGASIVAGVNNTPSAPSSSAPFHLHLRSSPVLASGTGGAGHLFMVSGGMTDPLGTDDPGNIYIMGGLNAAPLSTPSDLWLVPGVNAGAASAGVVWFTGANHTQATYRFDNPYAGGVAGTLYVGTPAGAEAIAFSGAENLAAAATLINSNSRLLTATQDGTNLSLHGDFGPAGDVTVIGDSTSGTLVAALGGTGTFTAGTLGDKVSVDVPQDGRLRVNGDLEITGSIIGTAFGSYKAVILADSPYTTQVTEAILGVRLTAGSDISVVLNAGYGAGGMVIIKDENLIANNLPGGQKITITDAAGGNVEGAASYDITVAGGAVTLYKNDVGDWFIY